MHPLGDMTAGESGAADVGDAVVQGEVRARRFPDELFAPIRISNFAAITLAIIEDLDLPDDASGGKRHCIIDHEMFADNVIDNEEALELSVLRRPPNFLAAQQFLLTTGGFDCPDLRGREFHVGRDEVIAIREAQFLRGRNRQVLDRIARERHRDADRGGQNPARKLVHIEKDSNATLGTILEKETDRAQHVIRAGRVRRIVERELVVNFQDNLRRGKNRNAEGVKLTTTLSGRQIVVGPGKSAGL